MLIIPALRRLRYDCCEFESSIGYIGTVSKTQNNTTMWCSVSPKPKGNMVGKKIVWYSLLFNYYLLSSPGSFLWAGKYIICYPKT